MKSRFIIIFSLIIFLFSFSCQSGEVGSDPSDPDSPADTTDVIKSDKSRITTPDSTEIEIDTLVSGNTAFALGMFQALKNSAENQGKNIVFSPYSISLALSMTYAGARNETEQQMKSTLAFSLENDRHHATFNALDLELMSRGQETKHEFKLKIANAIWGQAGYSFQPDFLDLLALNYGAGLRTVDYATATEQARQTINQWVSDQTANKINDLIPAGVLSAMTRLVLTNAIYFKANWLEPFDENGTAPGEFYLIDNSPVTVDMINTTAPFSYGEGEGYQAVEIPYEGSEMSMVFILPDTGKFNEIEANLSQESLLAMLSSFTYNEVTVSLPKFKFDFNVSLKDILEQLGMNDPFDSGKADFSGMNGQRDLFISNVIHKAYIGIDEFGTEAAAATAVVMEESCAGPGGDPKSFIANRPFFFLIRDMATDAILFIGRIMNPA